MSRPTRCPLCQNDTVSIDDTGIPQFGEPVPWLVCDACGHEAPAPFETMGPPDMLMTMMRARM